MKETDTNNTTSQKIEHTVIQYAKEHLLPLVHTPFRTSFSLAALLLTLIVLKALAFIIISISGVILFLLFLAIVISLIIGGANKNSWE